MRQTLALRRHRVALSFCHGAVIVAALVGPTMPLWSQTTDYAGNPPDAWSARTSAALEFNTALLVSAASVGASRSTSLRRTRRLSLTDERVIGAVIGAAAGFGVLVHECDEGMICLPAVPIYVGAGAFAGFLVGGIVGVIRDTGDDP